MSTHLLAPSETLNANGVTLRRWRTGDAGALLAAVRPSLAHLRPWMPWAKDGYGREEAAEFLTRSRQNWSDGTEFNYAIVSGGRRVVGSAGLMTRRGPGVLEIGYWVDVRHTGRGIAGRAAAALTAAGLAVPGIDRIEILHDEANTASAAVARTLGFRNMGEVSAGDGTAQPDGVDVLWRLDAADFAASRVPDLLGQRRYGTT